MNIQLVKPRIALTVFEKNGERHRYRPTITRMRKMLKSSLRLKIKEGSFIRLRVAYGKYLTNRDKVEEKCNFTDTNNYEDLKGVFEDFVDKSEWLARNRIEGAGA